MTIRIFCLTCIPLFIGSLYAQTTITYPVVVVGGTPAGIASAISAARAGSAVLVIENTRHIGGLITNGLTMSDIVKRNAVGGLFLEFVKKVHAFYVQKYGVNSPEVRASRDGYFYEPHVAELIFTQMVNGQGGKIKLLYHQEVVKAIVSKNKIQGIVLQDLNTKKRTTVTGSIFIDATYEGDFSALAGVPYSTGRESRDEYGEKQAGVIYCRFGFDEYLPGSTGKSDKAVQAFNFRFSMTSDPANKLKIEKPAQYNRNDYVLLLNDIKEQKVAPIDKENSPNKNGLSKPIQMWAIPNNKVNINNEHISPVMNAPKESFDLAEENWAYPHANKQERKRIFERYKSYQLGLIWFLQNDPEVPENFRQGAREWGLCKDEFTWNGGFPEQIYIRELRRIKGEYFFTQNDATIIDSISRTAVQSSSIAIAEYPFDCHAHEKYNPAFPNIRGGYFYIRHEPMQIPYGVIVPKKIDGLLVTVCVSASHVGYQPLRMEPVYMALGEAAGLAAHLAIKNKTEVRAVDVSAIQKELIRQKGVITYFDDLFVEDPDFEAFQLLGTTGFNAGYKANADSLITRVDAAATLKRLSGKTVVDTRGSEKYISLTDMKDWFSQLKWNLNTSTGVPVTNRIFARAVYLHLHG